MIITACLAGIFALLAVQEIAARDNSTCFPWVLRHLISHNYGERLLRHSGVHLPSRTLHGNYLDQCSNVVVNNIMGITMEIASSLNSDSEHLSLQAFIY